MDFFLLPGDQGPAILYSMLKAPLPSLSLETVVGRAQFYAGRLESLPASFREYKSSHRHPHHAVFYFNGGSGNHVIDFQSHIIEPPVLFFVRSGQVHSWSLSESIAGFALKVSEDFFAIAGNTLASSRFPFFSPGAPSSALYLREPIAAVNADFARLVCEYEGERHYDLLKTMAELIFLELNREYGKQYANARETNLSVYARFISLLETHFSRERSVAFYARRMGLNPGVLNRYCREQCGNGTKAVIHERLLLEIRRLLVHSDVSFAEIADHLRFSDVAYFSRYVKNHLGRSPGEIRSDARNVQ